jgi:hypothetical protein
MATRSIVTSHPDVECDVCGRRLLRGEQPDVFVSGGQRRMVCVLCAPRATHEGWLRESDGHTLNLRSSRPQRARSLLDRLRALREPESPERGPSSREPSSRDPAVPSDRRSRRARRGERNLYDFLDGPPTSNGSSLASDSEPVYGDELLVPGPAEHDLRDELPLHHVEDAQAGGGEDWVPSSADLASEHGDGEAGAGSPLSTHVQSTTGAARTTLALEVFNRGEHPRRIAGVARSLGEPVVRVAPVADSGSVVAVLVAWELCWYRYEIDLGDEAAGARLVAQGLELDELLEEERVANAVADERGELSCLPG